MRYIITLLAFFTLIQLAFAQEDYKRIYKQAVEHFEKDEIETGFELLNKSLTLNPSYFEALYARGFYLMQEGEHNRAIRDFDWLIQDYPDSAWLYLYRGHAKFYQERYQEAEIDYLIAYDLDTLNSEVLQALGQLYFSLDLYNDAIVYLDKSIKRNPKDATALYLRAYSFFQLNQYNKALQNLKRAKQNQKNKTDFLKLEAIIYTAQRRYTKALEIYEELRKDKSVIFDEEDFLNYGYTYYRQGKVDDAIYYLELPENHESSEIYYYLARCYYQKNNSKKGLELINKAIVLEDTLSEANAIFYYERAVLHSRLRNKEAAERDLLHAVYLLPEIVEQKDETDREILLLADALELLELSPNDEKIINAQIRGYQERAEVFIIENATLEANQTLNKAIKLDSLDAHTHTLFAILEGTNKLYEKALKRLDFAENLEKNKQLDKIYHTKAILYIEQEDYKKALELINQAIEKNAKTPYYFADRADVEFNLGNIAESLESINKAIALDSTNMKHFSERAFYYNENKAYQKALEDANYVLERSPHYPLAYYNRGKAYFGLKEYVNAFNDFQKVLEFFPDDEEVEALLEESRKKARE